MIEVFVPETLPTRSKNGFLIGQRSENCVFITNVVDTSHNTDEVGIFTVSNNWTDALTIYNIPDCNFTLYEQNKNLDLTKFLSKFQTSDGEKHKKYFVGDNAMNIGNIEFSNVGVLQAAFYRRDVVKMILTETDKLARINQIFLLFVDILFGLIIWVICYRSAWTVCNINYQSIIGHTAKRLGDGLLWMSQNPGGLKLNPQLAHFLSQFCNHHVRIWESYAVMLCNNCNSILQILCLWASPFGVTFFLGLTGDLVSILTLHFYCFYIYAVRLYHFWVTCLKSLWKLFFGKKINPLFDNRVDSIFSDDNLDHANRRLILGSLIFAIFVWLFPTIIVYYVVFATIRLLSLFLQSILSFFLKLFVHGKPILTILYYLNPHRFGTQLITPPAGRPVRFAALNLSDALEKYRIKRENSEIFSKLLNGDLI